MQQSNVFVDPGGIIYIAGFGSTSIPSQNRATRLEVDARILSYGTASEFISAGLHCSRERLAVSRQCYFENLLIHTNQILAEQVLLPDRRRFAAVRLLENVIRPHGPHRPEFSDKTWNMVRKRRHHDPPRRKPIRNIVSVLEETSKLQAGYGVDFNLEISTRLMLPAALCFVGDMV